jgi:hypothetical protein
MISWQPVGLAQAKLTRGSRQKSRLLPAATKLLSEKSAAGDFFPMTNRSHPGDAMK